MNIFPSSPFPPLRRTPSWGQRQIFYDSGAYQGASPLVKPLYNYSLRFVNRQRGSQSSLNAFFNEGKHVEPFLFKDPYDQRADGVARTMPNVTTFYLYDASSHFIIPDSADLIITSTFSGSALTNGSEYILDQDTGIITASISVTSDTLTWSLSYFRKGVFQGYSESSNLWENFTIDFSIQEII